ncbi:MAG TPA: FMN-binding negative transcriptional regulator [Burkholderiaceae bacterium]
MPLYQPESFRVDAETTLLEFIAENPFATVLSGGPDPTVTHLPMLAERDGDRLRLAGHVARANPHWRALESSPEALAIFHGPDAYVSPAWYTTLEAVPTWNYMVAHLHLRVATVHEADGKEAILKRLIAAFDPGYAAQWDGLDRAYRDRMLGAIVGLRAEVTRWDAKFKLSQNRPAQDRDRVVAALAQGSDGARGVASWMQRLRLVDHPT